MDFSALHLTGNEKKQLRRCARGKILRSPPPALVRAGLVVPNRKEPDNQGGFYVDGYRIHADAYAEYRRHVSHQRRSSWKETRRFWIPIILSNLIALASLAVSLLALARHT